MDLISIVSPIAPEKHKKTTVDEPAVCHALQVLSRLMRVVVCLDHVQQASRPRLLPSRDQVVLRTTR